MKTLSKDARGFVDEVAKYVGQDRHGKQMVPRVSALLTKVTSAAQKERVAEVSTVVALSTTEKSAITRLVSRMLAHDVACHFTVQSELLGGMKIQVADWVVDTSLASQLSALTRSLL